MNVEQEIISILMNRPANKSLANINANWFAIANLRWAYEAIMDLDDSQVDPLNVYGRLKQLHPDSSIQLKELNILQRSFVTDGNLTMLVKELRHKHLSQKLDQDMMAYHDAPTDANRQQVHETMDLLDNMETVDDDGSLDNEFERLDSNMEVEQPTGIKTMKSLDRLLGGGLYGGMLFTIGARPAVGKTAFCVNLAYDITAYDPEVHVDYFTLEMSKREMANRLISLDTGISSYKLRNPYTLGSSAKMVVKQSMQDYSKLDIRVYDRTPNLSDILTVIRRNASRAKPNKYVAIVDYIGLVSVPSQSERYLQVGEITRQLKVTANEYDVPIIALSQLSRAIETRMDKRPTLSDLRESGSIEQDSNVVGFLYKPNEEEAPQVERLAIEKNREGATGDIYLVFTPSEMKFMEIDREKLKS
ncbi:replicative DNA helicase [Secundilactobacillus pentosiphilus]|uniref:Replicative DNA helicase n=1 Tax=Secundilactobacillus pentosiphilus TaxID=1714682 RepID=A0A1Z5IZ10_9LACO|nr:DnaB-like helicase C-terminal domain-containing protein [Secundilactobacillus pentosiphilus]GAX07025.1 replicative DNA helicase [Secundilactobacillus pentosiphilus]